MALSKVVMPKLSEAMETGKLIKWLKKEGDRVNAGDILAEVETDKADVEMEAFGAGVLRKILVKEGDTAPVGSLIAVIAEPSEDISALVAGAAATPSAAARPAPAAPSAPAARPAVVAQSTTRERAGEAREPASSTPPASPGRIKASPLARKVAAQSGVDLHIVRGTGPGGRIVRKDVEAAAGGGGMQVRASVPARVRALSNLPEHEDLPLSQMRAIIAKRMPLSKGPVPHFYVSSEVVMDRAWDLRERLNAIEGRPKISVNDFVVCACAQALLQHPGVNASFQGDAIRVFHRAHIGIAVALDEGLITPVLRDCHAKTLNEIAVDSRDLTERARARKLKAQELSGATFSISNLGMYDVTEFSAIINPPEGAILAVGAVRRVPVVTDDGLGVGRRMMLTLSCDHRVMDGAMGARFLQDVKRLLEEPLRLLV